MAARRAEREKGGAECSRLMSNAAISVVSEVGVGARGTGVAI